MRVVGHVFLSMLLLLERAIAMVKRPETKLASWQYAQAKSSIKDGDIVLSRTNFELSNLFLPGDFFHCGVYYNGEVFEATTDGVRARGFDEWFFKKDRVAIVRATLPITDLAAGVVFLNDCLSAPYNYDFFAINTTKSWFCSEYAYRFLCIAVLGFDKTFNLRKRYGMLTVSPNDYFDAIPAKKFNWIGEFG